MSQDNLGPVVIGTAWYEGMDKQVCAYLVEGCPDCNAEEPFRQQKGHECDDLCRVFGDSKRRDPEFHALMHQPERCEKCNGIMDDHRGKINWKWGQCRLGYCNTVLCGSCGYETASMGPVGCPACSPIAKPESVKRLRRMYRARQR